MLRELTILSVPLSSSKLSLVCCCFRWWRLLTLLLLKALLLLLPAAPASGDDLCLALRLRTSFELISRGAVVCLGRRDGFVVVVVTTVVVVDGGDVARSMTVPLGSRRGLRR